MDMLGKLNEMREQMDALRQRLDEMTVEDEVSNGAVRVVATASGKIKTIELSDALVQEKDKEQIEDLVTVTVNRVLERAKKKEEEEMRKIAGGMLPNMPGLSG